MTTLKKGDKAPDFSGLDQDSNAHKLADYRKKSCFLYKASTRVAQPKLVILEIILSALKRITTNY
jgi:peroxiredoxin